MPFYTEFQCLCLNLVSNTGSCQLSPKLWWWVQWTDCLMWTTFFKSAFSFKSVCVNAPWHGMLSQRSASPALNFQMISSFNKESEFHWLFSVWCVCYDVLSERLNLEGGKKKLCSGFQWLILFMSLLDTFHSPRCRVRRECENELTAEIFRKLVGGERNLLHNRHILMPRLLQGCSGCSRTVITSPIASNTK